MLSTVLTDSELSRGDPCICVLLEPFGTPGGVDACSIGKHGESGVGSTPYAQHVSERCPFSIFNVSPPSVLQYRCGHSKHSRASQSDPVFHYECHFRAATVPISNPYMVNNQLLSAGPTRSSREAFTSRASKSISSTPVPQLRPVSKGQACL